MKTKLTYLLVFLIGGAAGWVVFTKSGGGPAHSSGPGAPAGEVRRIKFYQSPMHPWIKSDKPGRCTICGMELTPVYEGETGVEAADGTVLLGTNSIQVLHVASTGVKRVPVVRSIRLSGTIDDNDLKHRFISAYVDGRIEKLGVNFVGQEVKPGQLLAALYSPALLGAEREYAALAKSHVQSPFDSVQPLLVSARQRLHQMGLAPEQIDALPRKSPSEITSELLAPAAGTVVSKRVYEGQYVKEGEVLFEIADFSTMWVQLDAYETDLEWIRVGQDAEITTPSLAGHVVRGRVTFVDPNFDSMTRSTRVRIEVENPLITTNGTARRLLQHRVTATAAIHSESEALSVPRTAVLRGGREPVAYVDHGAGGYERRVIKTGRFGDDRVEVLEGLSEGERVVIHGNLLIDAQAQLNTGASEVPPVAVMQPAADPRSVAAITDFIKFAGRLSEALASDSLESFRGEVSHFDRMAAPLKAMPEISEAMRTNLSRIEGPPAASDLASMESARGWFVRFSASAVELARLAKAGGPGSGVHLFECPMTDRAIPGGPKRAVWLQVGAAIRNPYFGAQMLDCGTELKERP
jgi:membrane fusion protein, copper/silver efflux system